MYELLIINYVWLRCRAMCITWGWNMSGYLKLCFKVVTGVVIL